MRNDHFGSPRPKGDGTIWAPMSCAELSKKQPKSLKINDFAEFVSTRGGECLTICSAYQRISAVWKGCTMPTYDYGAKLRSHV